jgi:hypothetical protein
MLADDDELWRLLRSLDDLDHPDDIADYPWEDARAKFDALRRRLERDFNCPCTVNGNVQDANYFDSIHVPAGVTASGRAFEGRALEVRISNFGGLAVVLARDQVRPRFFVTRHSDAYVHPEDLVRIDSALSDLGYTLIPSEPLLRPYDGALGRDAVRANPSIWWIETWWIRYFDYH